MTVYGIDFGAGNSLAIHGPKGPVSKKALKLPRQKGGKTTAQEFIMVAEALMRGCDGVHAGDIVVESATIGSSGCEVQDAQDLLSRVPKQRLWTISNRAVKNYRADHKLEWRKGARYAKDGDPPPVTMTLEEQAEVHIEDAEIIYRIATETPDRLYWWRGPREGAGNPLPAAAVWTRANGGLYPANDVAKNWLYTINVGAKIYGDRRGWRRYTSVRPMDKRGYRDERAEKFMQMAPPYESLPDDLKEVTGNGKKYLRAFVMPLIMATDEPYLDDEDAKLENRARRYEKIIGAYDDGYPSFYRHATIVWMQKNAKILADTTRIGEVDKDTRKKAWQITQRQIRNFFRLMMEHQGR